MDGKNQGRLTTALLSSILATTVACLVMLYAALSRTEERWDVMPTPTRGQINAAVITLIQAGRSDELYSFYSQEVGDPIRAALYVQAALEQVPAAPVNLVIALGAYEGGHVSGIVGPNANGSIDVRPMGLNSITYRQYTVDELSALQVNIGKGAAHLANDWRALRGVVREDARWEIALARYNTGRDEGYLPAQVRYVVLISRYEWNLDRRFVARFPDAIDW